MATYSRMRLIVEAGDDETYSSNTFKKEWTQTFTPTAAMYRKLELSSGANAINVDNITTCDFFALQNNSSSATITGILVASAGGENMTISIDPGFFLVYPSQSVAADITVTASADMKAKMFLLGS